MHNIHHDLGVRAVKFYRGSNAVFLWVAFFLKLPVLAWLVLFFKIIPVIFSGKFDFVMLIFKKAIKKKEKEMETDAPSLRFAQGLSSAFLIVSLVLFYLGQESAGWAFIILTAIMCTVGALGFCFCSVFYVFFKKLFPNLTKETECAVCQVGHSHKKADQIEYKHEEYGG